MPSNFNQPNFLKPMHAEIIKNIFRLEQSSITKQALAQSVWFSAYPHVLLDEIQKVLFVYPCKFSLV